MTFNFQEIMRLKKKIHVTLTILFFFFHIKDLQRARELKKKNETIH